jgi:hypothetical protein
VLAVQPDDPAWQALTFGAGRMPVSSLGSTEALLTAIDADPAIRLIAAPVAFRTPASL